MLRYSFVLAGLLSLAGLSAGGCQSCSSGHDYDPPVANCQCGSCGAPCSCGCDQAHGTYVPSAQPVNGKVNPAYAQKSQNNYQQRTNQPAMTNASAQQ